MTDYLYAFFDSPTDWQALLKRAEVSWAVPVVFLLVALWLLYPWFCRSRAVRRVRANLQRLGKSNLGDVTLDNGMEGFVFIDQLVLTPTEILVITLMNVRGIIFGGEKIDSWARVVGRRTFKFPNPVVGSEERVLAVKYHIPDVQVRGLILFDEKCTFPKGKPPGALLPQEITTEARQWEEVAIPPALQAAWDKLVDMAQQGSETYGRDVALMRGSDSSLREITAVGLSVLAIFWTAWQLLT